MQRTKSNIKHIHLEAGVNACTKQEKGSVAVVVIVAILFIVALSTTMYFAAVNRKNTGDEATEAIKKAYEKDVNNMDDLYATYQENGLYIYTKEDLEEFRDRVNSGITFEGQTVYLMNDIDLNAGNYTENEDGTVTFTDDAEQWDPIGDSSNYFKGVFEGNSYEISGLYINDSTKDYQGLFGCIDTNAEIYNVGLVNGSISAKEYVGGIVGEIVGDNINGVQIIGCYNEIMIEGEQLVGGIVGGGTYATIKNSYNKGNITATNQSAGGIIGQSDYLIYDRKECTIRNCYNRGKITADTNVGGIAGSSAYINIYNCYNLATISGTEIYGEIIGYFETGTLEYIYYLEDTNNSYGKIGDEDTSIAITDAESLTEEDFLGDVIIEKINQNIEDGEFIKDTENKNDGYPILR